MQDLLLSLRRFGQAWDMHPIMLRALRHDDIQSSLRTATSSHVHIVSSVQAVWNDLQLSSWLQPLLADAQSSQIFSISNSVPAAIIVVIIRVHGEASSLGLSVEFCDMGNLVQLQNYPPFSSHLRSSLVERIECTQERCLSALLSSSILFSRFVSAFCNCPCNL